MKTICSIVIFLGYFYLAYGPTMRNGGIFGFFLGQSIRTVVMLFPRCVIRGRRQSWPHTGLVSVTISM